MQYSLEIKATKGQNPNRTNYDILLFGFNSTLNPKYKDTRLSNF